MSEIIQIQKLNGWWEEINFHFMKYFPIWNNITYGMSSFSAVHNTLTERGMRQLSLVDMAIMAIFIQTDLWRYLCDCDPLGAFSRQRWAGISNERGMSPAVKLNIPTPDRRIYSAGLSQRWWPLSPSLPLRCCCSSESDPCCSYPGHCRLLQTAGITRANTANEQTPSNPGQSFVIMWYRDKINNRVRPLRGKIKHNPIKRCKNVSSRGHFSILSWIWPDWVHWVQLSGVCLNNASTTRTRDCSVRARLWSWTPFVPP